MKYNPITSVWEITMGCNMRCMHCGSICESALEDELTTDEALDLCRQIGDIGLHWITLSGGEPFTRKDWPLIVKELTDNNVSTNMLSNGWMLDKETLQKAKDSNVSTIAISVDGTEKIHDEIRKEGSFKRLSNAFELMDQMDIVSGAVTTVSTKNIDILDDIRTYLISKNVKFWQLQIGLPMGSMAINSEMILEPDAIDTILDFVHKSSKMGGIKVYPADCIGYYNKKESEIRKVLFSSTEESHWEGCHAGKRSFGILQNGDILGCTSIRDKEFIEGSIREKKLKEIWEGEEAFKWSRDMNKSKLKGNCKICDFGDLCNGGCPNTRLTTRGSIYEENKYCSYNYALDNTKELIRNTSDTESLYQKAENYATSNKLTLSYLILDELSQREENEKVLNLFGYVAFMSGDYHKSKDVNEKALAINNKNSYALKGLGLSTYKIGEDIDGAINYLNKAVKLDTTEDLDSYYDLATVYYELGRYSDARNIIEDGISKSPLFKANSEDLYRLTCK